MFGNQEFNRSTLLVLQGRVKNEWPRLSLNGAEFSRGVAVLGVLFEAEGRVIRIIHDAHPTGKPLACSKPLQAALSAAPQKLGLILGTRRATICGMFLLGALGVCVKEMKARLGEGQLSLEKLR